MDFTHIRTFLKGRFPKYAGTMLLLLLVFLLSSCRSFGPRAMYDTRPLYNDVYNQTEAEQLLKNIVRIRYTEPTSFLKLTSVNTSFTLNPAASVAPGFTYSTTGAAGVATTFLQAESVGATGSINYSDSPSFSYLPLDSKEFVTSLFTPVTLAEIGQIYTGKIYDFHFLSRLIFDSIGGIGNASALAVRSLKEAPEYRQYYQLIALLNSLIREKIVTVHEGMLNGQAVFVILLRSPQDVSSPRVLRLKKLLDVPADASNIFLTEYEFCGSINLNKLSLTTTDLYADSCPPSKIVHVELRSIYQMMRYLSYGVDLPPADVEAGYFTAVTLAVDRATLEGGLFHVRTSDVEPVKNVYIKVYLHHHWFYVLNSDLDTKITLAFVYRLFTLIAGSAAGEPSNAPVLTLPVR